jgi:hypothetical protein
MLESNLLWVRASRPPVYRTEGAARPGVARVNRRRKGASSSHKKVGLRRASSSNTSALPEGWSRHVAAQARNLARAIEMLEQALAMLDQPRMDSSARAQCVRGAGLITLVAASELLVVAGWYEADGAVAGGTVERE